MKIRKTVSLILSAALIFALTLSVSAAGSAVATDIRVTLDGKVRTYDVPVVNLSGRTMLPVRFLANDVGIPNDDEHIIYDNATESAKLISPDGSIEATFKRGSKDVFCVIGGEIRTVRMDVECVNYGGRLFIPVRFASEIFGLAVDWDNHTRTVLLRTPESMAETAYVLENSKNAREASKKYTVKNDFDINISNGSVNIPSVTATATLQRDLEKKLWRVTSENPFMPQEGSKVEIADAENSVVYKLNPDGSADKLSDLEAELRIDQLSNSDTFSEAARIRLFTEPLPGGGVRLYGDLYEVGSSLFNSSLQSADPIITSLRTALGGNTEVSLALSRLYVDMRMDPSGALTEQTSDITVIASNAAKPGEGIPVNITVKMTFDYTSDFTITLPAN